MPGQHISTDYLVIGAGISGLSFVDELVTQSKASITIVDKRHAPGGHWVDAYPYVKLHQPSTFYGVESTELSDGRIDQHGFNKGYLSLASGTEVTAYCHALMKDRLLASGRVTFLPSTEYLPNGILQNTVSKKQTKVTIRKKLVDASWNTNNIPLHHSRSFDIEDSVTCIPPNHLPRLAPDFEHFTVLGAGKTGMDACLWLLSNGVDPDRLRWVVPNDYWYFNRSKFQTSPEFFVEVCTSFAQRMEILAAVNNVRDFALGMEKIEAWLRLDPKVEATLFHAAIISPGELEEVRKIKDVVRQGYVRNITSSEMVLTAGTVPARSNTLYIDCTASAFTHKAVVPIFQPDKIVLQLMRFPFVAFSAAMVAFLETLPMSDAEKNSFAAPLGFGKTVDDYIVSLSTDLRNSERISRQPQLRDWVSKSRLHGLSRTIAQIRPDEKDKIAALMRMKKATGSAQANLPRLIASSKQKAML